MDCTQLLGQHSPLEGAQAPATANEYDQTVEQSVSTVMRVLLNKHIILGWRRGRIVGAFVRTLFAALIPTIIWFAIPKASRDDSRPSLVQITCPLLGILFMVSLCIQFIIEIVSDKENKMRYVQEVNGVSYVAYWSTYYIFYLLVTSLASLLYLTLVMCVAPIYKFSNFILMFAIYTLGFLQSFFICMMLSTVVSRARMAGVICGVLCAMVVCGAMLILPMISTNSVFIYALESLIPFVSALNVLGAVGKLEDIPCACGFTFSSFFHDVGGWNMISAKVQLQPSAGAQFFILLADCIIYGLCAMWLDQVYQGEFGTAKPWNFCLRSIYMCPDRSQPLCTADQHPPTSAAALDIKELVKVFGSHRAVDGMTLEVNRGELFALLGHNGAGKTTAINCITGMLPMTSGSINVCGVDVALHQQEARRYMSVCPQDNPLYLEYTVTDHLSFFAALRGISAAQALNDLSLFLTALGLADKRDARVHTLSGGQKRRLWVATSLLGKTSMVFLDEPTSGMDPANRRLLWDLLVRMKNLGRCILFTTHYLDEADVLAQRKAVLDKGKVCALGTSWDLKKKFGSGYHLRVICAPSAPETRSAEILALVQSHISSAEVEIVPEEERSHAIDAPKQWSYILPYDAMHSFSAVLCDLEKHAQGLEVIDFAVETTSLEEVFMALGHAGKGSAGFSGDVAANLPDGSIAVPDQQEMADSVEVQGPPETAGHQHEAGIPQGPLVLADPSIRQPVNWVGSVLAVFGLRWRQLLRKKRSLFATMFVPAALMLLAGWSMATQLKQQRCHKNHESEELRNRCNQLVGTSGANLGITVSICLAIALPYFTTTLVTDRMQRCTHLATSQGLPLSAYWAGTFISNYIHFLVLALWVPVCLLVFNTPFYNKAAPVINVLVSAICCPVPMLLFAYSFSRVFQTAEASAKAMPAICLMASVIPCTSVFLLLLFAHTSEEHDTRIKLERWASSVHVLMCFVNPFYVLPGSFTGIGNRAVKGLSFQLPNVFGSAIGIPIIGASMLSGFMCFTLVYDFQQLKGFLLHSARGELQLKCGEVGGFAIAEGVADPDVGVEKQRVEEMSLTDPNQAVIYKRLVHIYNKGSPSEVRAVRGISLAVSRGECFTLLGPNGAGKTSTLDVLTGAIFPPTQGEVIVNGHSITGCAQSRLEAFQSLGYCPQIDPLWPTLTGRQHLLFYGRMKGLPEHAQPQEAAVLLKAMGFSDFDADKPTAGYSGGMKRKICVAIALIGSPSTLLLDEPSAAVDAAAKRHLWRVVRQRQHGQTVILTTHSMEEAEALSDRLAIQVKGQLRCIGTPHHIKNTHGAGYQLEILVNKSSLKGASPAPEVVNFIKGLCSDAMLLEQHESRYLFQLPVLKSVGASQGEVSLAALFAWMQDAYQTIGMQDYSISRPSLEQVFIRFSKEQQNVENEDENAVSRTAECEVEMVPIQRSGSGVGVVVDEPPMFSIGLDSFA